MSETKAERRLVKSPPELWAEVSDPDSLARHLGAFGEIRVTDVRPETTVAWEGTRASGTVSLEPSGWGTRVVLTAQAAAPPEAEAPPEPEPDREAEAGTAVGDAAPAPPPAPAPARRGLLARLRFWRRAVAEVPAPPRPPVPAPPAPDPEPLPEPEPEPEPAEPVPARMSPDEVDAALAEVLDTLGAAHHRPFSRA